MRNISNSTITRSDGVRRALPTARVGGPEMAGGPGGKFLQEFLWHCAHGTNYVTGKTVSPLDFISFHAKGSPSFVDGHVRMGMASQLRNINDAFAVIASFPEFKNTPVVIGESDPGGCAACTGADKGYRNGTMYSSYTAASFPRAYELADKHGVNLEGALTWAFEFENQPYFAGFRALPSNGLDLPVLNVFRMFAKMSGDRLAVESSAGLDEETIRAKSVREHPDVSALASLDKNRLCVLLSGITTTTMCRDRTRQNRACAERAPSRRGACGETDRIPDRQHAQQFLRKLETDGLAKKSVTGAGWRIRKRPDNLQRLVPQKLARGRWQSCCAAETAASGRFVARHRVESMNRSGKRINLTASC